MKANRYICIFGGGAIRGVVYPGAVKALEELEIEIPTYIGSSVGAIFAALCSVGCKSTDLSKVLHEFNAFMFKDINFSLGDFSLSKGEVFEKWIREKIEIAYYGERYEKGKNAPVTFSDIGKDVYILSTDLKTNKKFIFSKYSTPNFELAEAVKISASFPGLMKPTEIDDKILVDGDLAKSIPLWKGIKDLKNEDCRILEFRLEGNCMNLKTVFDYMNTIYSSMSYFCSENLVDIFGERDKYDYVVFDTKDVLLFDFQMNNEEKDKLSQIGYDTTMKYFTKTIVDKKRLILPFYEQTLSILKEIETKLLKNDTRGIKDLIIEYFCIKNEITKNADTKLVEETKSILQELAKDINENILSFLNSINHQKKHREEIEKTIVKYQGKVDELSKYINNYSNNYD